MSKIYEEFSIAEALQQPRIPAMLYRWLRRELVYTSNAIEHNKLTREQTGEIIAAKPEQITDRSVMETINLAKTLDDSLNKLRDGAEIDADFIMNMHESIMHNIDCYGAGYYRNCNVRPLGCVFSYPNYIKVPRLMDELIYFINNCKASTYNTAIEAHYKFVKIHPFSDGNGRTGRLLMNLILMKDGIVPIFVTPETRKEYIDVLDNRRMHDDHEPYYKFMNRSFYTSVITVCDFLDRQNFR